MYDDGSCPHLVCPHLAVPGAVLAVGAGPRQVPVHDVHGPPLVTAPAPQTVLLLVYSETKYVL